MAARKSLYDYGDLTQFEQRVMRNAVMFYAFHRKNTNAFVRAMVDNPERIGLLVRAGTRQREAWLGDEKNVRDTDLARIVLARWQGEDDRKWRVETGAVNVGAEGAVMLQRLARAFTGDTEAIAKLAQMSNPIVDAFGRLVLDVDVGTAYRASTPGGSTVPEYFVMLLDELGMKGVLELKQQSPMAHQARDKAQDVLAGQPKRWEATGDRGTKLWQLWKVLAGRVTVDTVPDTLVGLAVLGRALGLDTPEWVNAPKHGSEAAHLAQAAGFLVKPEDPDPMGTARGRQGSEIRKYASDEYREGQVE